MTQSRSGTPSEATSQRCAFCGFLIPAGPVRGSDGSVFCSERCRDAAGDGDEPFAGRFDFKWYATGVTALDALLPRGMPANAFVLLAGEEGIRHRGLQTELLWRGLRRGEPAILVSYVDPPMAVIEHFLSFGWNVLPYLESGQLRIIDCLTSRLREAHRDRDRQVAWHDYLEGFLGDAVTVVEEPANLRSVEGQLHETLEALSMMGSGLVVVDSLTEVDVQAADGETEGFIKEVRDDICTRLFVPIFASTTRSREGQFAQDHAYLFDGIVEMRRNERAIPGTRLKQLSIRKMDGVSYRPHWTAYEQAGLAGFEPFDPHRALPTASGVGSPSIPPGPADPGPISPVSRSDGPPDPGRQP